MLAKINRLKDWQAALIIVAIGFAVFSPGLTNPFQGDDLLQIVNNVPVHSIANIKLFFEGGTFYNGRGLAPLSGIYFRPLMTTVFSLVYTLFGNHAFYFHLVQLLICIGSAIILYQFFLYSFKPVLALFLALIFLIHPIDSQNVFQISAMQEALFFFFGILSLWLLVRFRSIRSLFPVAACLLLSLFSKETGILFVVMALVYLFWWNRQRFYTFLYIIILPIVLYIILRIHAVGILSNPDNAPIDRLTLAGRLFTAPSIMLLYISKLIFPWKLASSYYWVYPTFSLRHFLVPLLIDVTVIVFVVYLAFMIRKRASRAMYYTFLFFAIWCAIGMLMALQIIPQDMTASERYFYFPMAGVLGMSGVVLTVFHRYIRPEWLIITAALLIIGILGFRTALRGPDWRSNYSIAVKDIQTSPDNFNAYNYAIQELLNQGKYGEAQTYALRSIRIYPDYLNYFNLGTSSTYLGDYAEAMSAYNHALKYNDQAYIIYENLGALTVLYENQNASHKFLIDALNKFPQDANLWLYLALLDGEYNNNAAAKTAISNAVKYGLNNASIYNSIINDQPNNVDFVGKNIIVR